MASRRFGNLEILSVLAKLPFDESVRFHVRHVGKAIGFSPILKMLNPMLIKNLIAGGTKNILPVSLMNMLTVGGDKEAIICGDVRLTCNELKDRVLSLANWMVQNDVQPGDKVATFMGNSHEVMETLLAASFAGCPNPGVNWHLKGEELAKTINVTKPKVMVISQEFVSSIAKIRDKIPSVKQVLVTGGKTNKGMLSYEKAISQTIPKMPRDRFILGIAPYTSGTTGVPKSVNMYDSVSLLFNDSVEAKDFDLWEYVSKLFEMLNAGIYLGVHKIEDCKSMIVTPLYHAGTIAGLLPFMFGASFVIVPRFDPESILKTIQDEQVSWTFMVPTMLRRIGALPDDIKAKYDLSSMRSLISAAAPCPPDLKNQMNELFMAQGAPGPVFHEYYGSSETQIVTVLNPEDYQEKPERIKSVGKIRCGDLKIIDTVTNTETPVGEEGSILVRTVNTLTLNYGGNGDLLKKAYKSINNKKFYIDGVIGRRDEDDFIYLTDRIKDMVISGGVNVFPGEVESALANHPLVEDVAVFGVPDPDLGEVMRAEVQLYPGEKLSEKQALNFCKKQGLFGYKLPKYVGFTDKLPRRIDGKLIKRDLKAKYWPEGSKIG